MVLLKQNCGIYLTKEWHDPDRERQQCVHDQRGFSTADRSFYEVTGTGITDGLGYQIDNACIMDSNPMEPDTQKKTIDIRDRPEVSG